jgi:hypothetical protein
MAGYQHTLSFIAETKNKNKNKNKKQYRYPLSSICLVVTGFV